MEMDMIRRIEVAEGCRAFSVALFKLSTKVSECFMYACTSCGSRREHWLSQAVEAQKKLDDAVRGMNALLGAIEVRGEA